MTTQSITPFLWFNDQAIEAAKFYTSLFKNSKIVEIRRKGKEFSSATFRLDGHEFVAFNGGLHQKLTPAISLFVKCRTQREIDRLWNKLVKGGKPLQCGWLTDKFGLSWQIIPEILTDYLEDKDPKKAERVWNAMMGMVKIDIAALKRAYEGKD